MEPEKQTEDQTGDVLSADENNSSPMQISQEKSSSGGTMQSCSSCKKNIDDRYLLKAIDQYWHEDCLKCSCCDCRLGEVGSTLFIKANLLLCRRDYLRLFGATGYCAACSKMIPAFEMVMKARGNVYHLECFACQQCNHRFCVGDKFYLCDNKILCEYDYDERVAFASLSYFGNRGNAFPQNVTALKRQPGNGYHGNTVMTNQTMRYNASNVSTLNDDRSSGYGSPSPGSL